MGEVQSDTEFQVELLSLRETVGKIFETIFKTEVLEMHQFTKEDIGVPDDDEIWHDALRVSLRPVIDIEDVAYILKALESTDGRRKQLYNPSDIR